MILGTFFFLEKGSQFMISLSCACLINQLYLILYKHVIYHIKAEYLSYLVVYIMYKCVSDRNLDSV